MKYAFYPGCVSRGGCPELYPSAVKVSAKLDIELEELKDVGCTGAGVLPQYLSDPINARTFAKAEAMGLPIMTICSTCQGVMSQANYRLKADPEYRTKINKEYLSEEGLEYKGTTEVKHLLWVLFEDYGIERLKPLLRKPLKGLRVSPFYGCYIRRPPEAITPTKELNRRKNYLDELIEILGAEVADGWKAYGRSERKRRGLHGYPLPSLPSESGWQPTQGGSARGKRNRAADPPLAPVPGPGPWL